MKHQFKSKYHRNFHPCGLFHRFLLFIVAHSPDQKGLTLAEMLVVTALIGIICAIAVPNFPVMLRSYRLRAATNELASTLQMARVTAISQNSDSVISFDTASQTYTVFSDNGDGGVTFNDGVQGGSEPTLKWVDVRNAFNNEVTLLTPSFGNITKFNSRGFCTLNGTITLRNSSGSTGQVVLSPGGSVKTFYP